MTRLALALLLAGCGSTATCPTEGEYHCGAACVSVCRGGEWRQVTCPSCQQRVTVAGQVNACSTFVECS